MRVRSVLLWSLLSIVNITRGGSSYWGGCTELNYPGCSKSLTSYWLLAARANKNVLAFLICGKIRLS